MFSTDAMPGTMYSTSLFSSISVVFIISKVLNFSGIKVGAEVRSASVVFEYVIFE